MRMRAIVLMILILTSVTLLAGCQETDVIAKGAVSSFEALIESKTLNVEFSETENTWTLFSPENEAFTFSTKPENNDFDLIMSLELNPFIDAGLITEKLPEYFIADEEQNRLMIYSNLGDLSYDGNKVKTITGVFSEITSKYRDKVGYHLAMDHYNITLGNGNGLEWAKDMNSNDKDIVFVLHAQTLIDAGVNPEAVEGWKFAAVEMMDDNGKVFFMDKLLKPFELN